MGPRTLGSAALWLCLGACQSPASGPEATPAPTPAPLPSNRAGAEADVVLFNARVYTLSWPEPQKDGTVAPAAPHDEEGWHPDAEAIVIKDGKVLFSGTNAEARAHAGPATKLVDLAGATVLPGFIDSHAHISTHSVALQRVNLVGVKTEDEAIKRIAARAREVPKGEWVEAWGFDEGAWANHYPDNTKLSAAVPDHPVRAVGLHGFASWNNKLALQNAGIDARTRAPVGGEIVMRAGKPTGILLNNASDLFDGVVPAPGREQQANMILAGLEDLAAQGYVAIHEAGASREVLQAFQDLETTGSLPIRVYVMLSATSEDLMREWIDRGPSAGEGMLAVRSVKAYYDASLGVRGARLLEDYADKPGHRGVSGSGYGFNQDLVGQAMAAGFQVGIHAIGDAGNRETLNFFESVYRDHPRAKGNRNRIEHAQIVHPDDQPRFAQLAVIASMEPPHMAEDLDWAEDRLGPRRAGHGYAWRSLRQAGARLAFNSDLPGSDPSLFYGLHSAITRKNRDHKPAGGWFPEQAMTPEEAVRGYTIWNAYAGFTESAGGNLAVARWADMTVIDIDPFVLGETDPAKLLDGKVVMTIVAGQIVHEGR